MSTAQTLLILGGLINILASIVVAYALYWVRVRDPQKSTDAGLVSHKITLWNGFLLFGLSIAIVHTGFTPEVNNSLAIAEVLISVLAGARSVINWGRSTGNIFSRESAFLAPSVGVGHIVDLIVVSGILYGVTRTVLGI